MRRMTIIGLAALCALALSAMAATGASAAGTTAFTCVEGTPKTFSDPDCTSTSGELKYTHVPITEETTLSISSLSNPILEGTLAGAAVELTAESVECVECMAENKEVGGVMEVKGSGGKLKFNGVKAVGLPHCTVGATEGTNMYILTEKLKFTTTSSTGATLEPETGTILATFNIVASGGECTIAGNNITVTGVAPVTLKGSKLTVNVTKGEKLLFLEGGKAGLKGEGTVTAGKTGSGVHHPVALTAT